MLRRGVRHRKQQFECTYCGRDHPPNKCTERDTTDTTDEAETTRFKCTGPALAYFARVCYDFRWLKLSLDHFDPDDVVERVLARDVVWLANFVVAWLREDWCCISKHLPRALPGTMCQTLESLLIAMDLGYVTKHYFTSAYGYLHFYPTLGQCKAAILEGSFNTLMHFLREIVPEYREEVERLIAIGYDRETYIGRRYREVCDCVRTTLTSMQQHGVLKQLTADGLLLDPPNDGADNQLFTAASTSGEESPQPCLRSQIAKQLVNAVVALFNSKKPEKAKTLLRRLPGDVVRRFVIPDIPMFRADIYSVLYYNLRVITTEAYLDVLLACRTRRNTISSMHCAFHDRQRRFQVAPYNKYCCVYDRDVLLPLPVEFVPREHSTVDHTHLHMYAEVNPRWTCRDAAELSHMRCIVSREEFEINFLALTGMNLRLLKLREHGFVIAGGSLVLSLLPLLPPDATLEERRDYYHTHHPTADVNIYPYATPTPLHPAVTEPHQFHRFLEHLHADVFGGEDMLVTSSQRLITIVRRSTHVVVQIPYGDWREPLDVVENADVDCAGVYYSDHTGVRMTLRAGADARAKKDNIQYVLDGLLGRRAGAVNVDNSDSEVCAYTLNNVIIDLVRYPNLSVSQSFAGGRS